MSHNECPNCGYMKCQCLERAVIAALERIGDLLEKIRDQITITKEGGK